MFMNKVNVRAIDMQKIVRFIPPIFHFEVGNLFHAEKNNSSH